MANQTQIQAIPFNSFGKLVLKATEAGDKAAVKMREAVQMAMQQFVDLNAQANGRTEDSCKALQKSIKESEVVANSVALGQMESKTWTEYAQSAARALYWDIPFEQGLKNNPDLALPWSKKGKSGARSGQTRTTNDAALIKTLQKAIQQARLTKDDALAAGLFDLAVEKWPDFKESAE